MKYISDTLSVLFIGKYMKVKDRNSYNIPMLFSMVISVLVYEISMFLDLSIPYEFIGLKSLINWSSLADKKNYVAIVVAFNLFFHPAYVYWCYRLSMRREDLWSFSGKRVLANFIIWAAVAYKVMVDGIHYRESYSEYLRATIRLLSHNDYILSAFISFMFFACASVLAVVLANLLTRARAPIRRY